MKNTLKIDHINQTLVMDNEFYKRAENVYSPEFAKLQEVRNSFPTYRIIKKTIKKNPAKETYKGLTYDYMERYMLSHGTEDEIKNNLKEYRELRLIGECRKNHCYSVVKSWFLATFTEIEAYGIKTSAEMVLEREDSLNITSLAKAV